MLKPWPQPVPTLYIVGLVSAFVRVQRLRLQVEDGREGHARTLSHLQNSIATPPITADLSR